MKIELNEIWNFIDLAPTPDGKGKKMEWHYALIAGKTSFDNLVSVDILELKKDESFDTELLPSVFTFREILWQPNVYTQPSLCVPQLNILKVFCEEYIETHANEDNTRIQALYLDLLKALSDFCQQALDRISKQEAEVRIASILGELRKRAFPIIKFFIFHPMNREDYKIDALNRLNYAVKIMLTQYNNKYDDLKDPYWTVGKRVIAPEKPIQKEEEKTQASPSK